MCDNNPKINEKAIEAINKLIASMDPELIFNNIWLMNKLAQEHKSLSDPALRSEVAQTTLLITVFINTFRQQ